MNVFTSFPFPEISKAVKSNLNKRKKSLVEVAKEVRENEQSLITLEQQIKEKTLAQQSIEESLIEDRKSISDLVLALQRIRRIPPEAIIAKPDTPLKTAQSTMLLESILPRIYKRADQLKVDLKQLDEIITSLEEDKKSVQVKAKKLKRDKDRLSSLLSEQERIYAKTEKNVKQQKAALKKISAQARDLKDLVKKIEKKKKTDKARKKKTTAQKPTSPPIPKAGQAQLPVSGFMTVRYGTTDDIGATSKGIKIRSRPSALVIAPMGGVVEYTGKFKGYGNMVIIQHQKKYHSLIAGMGNITTNVGRAVSAGEPIGKMSPSTGNADNITLYYELRYNGKTINPSKRISGLR